MPLIPELPDPAIVKAQIENAINKDMRPATFLFEFMSSGKPEANAIANFLLKNPEAVKLLTSSKGRKYIRKWLDDTLNYLQRIAETSP